MSSLNGTNLRKTRVEKGVSQTELAERSGVARPRIVEYETGRKDFMNATLKTARRLADALDTSIDRLLPDKPDEEKE
ncbi:helix-turn-helix transcriptional regulator [Bifidobacterium felsineum]|uniref:helix-turn-helix transcriptional regulator n=1 Tax=Bifidobacterium felsineum TaxID=2045440 RepID=UPI001BDDAF42|nr:helix-turn-helix transcriptional regulator [Bifidobacterium felsineum]MBT1164650.1 helix-turn-helix transcriptional regulator [Bifidobacterium felsineum]